MHPPVLTIDEQSNIESGSWFSRLSPPLREAILARAQVRRVEDGAMLSARGAPAEEWCGVARGAVRVSSVSLSGKQVTLTYVEPGTWFGDIALFDGMPRTHDANAHGATTLLVVRKPDFKELLARSYGVRQGDEIRVGLQLAQEDIAQLLGASRQRVNQELKGFEREGAVRIEPTRLVVLSKDKLLAIANR